jgi:hypothetical protein
LAVNAAAQQPSVTFFGGTYLSQTMAPNAIITFSDGALGWLYASEVINTIQTRTWNSGSTTKEYGQLYKFPFPVRVMGIWCIIDPDADCDLVLYSDPLGTPVAERTVSLDANTASAGSQRRLYVPFTSAYDVPANTAFGVVYKPTTTTNISTNYKILNSAAHRVVDVYGTEGYAISRASGAFANVNSSLEHHYIGPMIGGFDAGGRSLQINNPSLVG